MPNLLKCNNIKNSCNCNNLKNKIQNKCNCNMNNDSIPNIHNKKKKLNFKCCTSNICSSLHEVECFLGNSKNLLKSIKLYKLLKH